jgi:hypothetical protein
MNDLDQVKGRINELAAEHEREADDHARRATEHTDAARRLRELAALIERAAKVTT